MGRKIKAVFRKKKDERVVAIIRKGNPYLKISWVRLRIGSVFVVMKAWIRHWYSRLKELNGFFLGSRSFTLAVDLVSPSSAR